MSIHDASGPRPFHGDPALPAELPPELNRWNWGAFLLNWIWGLGNRSYIALLMFVPLVNIAMPFVLGARGNRWAWRNGQWDSVAHFRRVQRLWAIWGVVILLGSAALVGGIVGLVFLVLGSSEPYRLGVAKLKASPEAIELLGEPIATGTPRGSITTEGDHGEADLDFSADGPRGKGSVHLKAAEDFGDWRLTTERLKADGRDGVVDLVPPEPATTAPRLGRFRLQVPGAEGDRTGFTTADKKIALLFNIRGASVGTRLTADWVRIGAGANGGDGKLVSNDLVVDEGMVGKDLITFTVSAGDGLPKGSYRVDVSVDGTLVRSVGFTVAEK